VLDYDERKCLGCVVGCDSCELEDNSICLRCSKGLALFQNDCVSECPFDYLKSSDGSICEFRTYLLDKTLIYFPGLGGAVVLFFVSMVSYFVTNRKSKLISNYLVFIQPLQLAMIAYLIVRNFEREYWLLVIGFASIFFLHYIMNLLFLLYFQRRIRHEDDTFSSWLSLYPHSTNFVLGLSMIISFKCVRLLYSRLFGLQKFTAAYSSTSTLHRPILIASVASLVTFSLPVLVFDMIGLIYLKWGTQIYIELIESMLLCLLEVALLGLEYRARRAYSEFILPDKVEGGVPFEKGDYNKI